MGGGGARLALSAVARSLRQRSTSVPASSAALHLLETKVCVGQPGITGFPADSTGGSKVPWGSAWALAAAGLMAFSSATTAKTAASTVLEEVQNAAGSSLATPRHSRVVFVLGGPGSGKGTQCAKIVDNYGFVHLSAGDLLRAEINSGSENGTVIQNMIKEGKIVPSEVTVRLLQKAMEESKADKFLIDGFPRNEENRAAFERVVLNNPQKNTGIVPEFILFFDCPEEEMERRILGRNQGRVDDNIETIRKRFKVFVESSIPVVKYYETAGKVHKINATRNIDEIFDTIQPLFKPFIQDDLLRTTEELLRGIDSGDYSTYQRLCHPQLTAFEPEAQGQLVEGLDFHKFYFDLGNAIENVAASKAPSTLSTIACPKVSLLGSNVGIVTYTRLQQKAGSPNVGCTYAYNETRVWERRKNSAGEWEWKNVHFHRSKVPTI